jgi:lysyl-tRNA synthetase class 2
LVEGPQSFVLADASHSLRVSSERRVELSVGDHVLCEIRFTRAGANRARILYREPAPEPRGVGEFTRLAGSKRGGYLRARHEALACIRRHFAARDFVEVSTPVRVVTPGLDANVDAIRASGGWLRTSPEFHMKRLLTGGLPRIYQLGACFRANERGALHEPEFTMLEWYRAFASEREVMADTEALVQSVVQALTGGAVIRRAGTRVDVTPPFSRLSVQAAFRRYAQVADALQLCEHDEARYFELFVTRVEPALARRTRPVFLTHYPLRHAALARQSASHPGTAERFELYLGGVELCNGFSELTDAREQLGRFQWERALRRREGRPVYALDRRFLSALEEGMPPAAGNALGVERLLMLALGADEIEQVMAFSERER